MKEKNLDNKSSCSILMYSHDGQGLGHLRRNTNIARQAVQDLPNCNALLLTGHKSIPFQPLPFGMDFIKLPSIIRVNHDEWEPNSLSISNDTIHNLRTSLIQQAAEHFTPDIFIVDFMPSGIWNELLPTLKSFRESENPPITILGLRDIIDHPELTKAKWEKEGYYEIIREFYDHVFIYGSPHIYDTANHYGLVDDLEEKVTYCGYVCSQNACKPKMTVRRELGIQAENLIVITAGSGGDAYQMMRHCLHAVQELHNRHSFEVVLITGPVMDFEEQQSLRYLANDLPVRILSHTDSLHDLMNASDLLICMGGYNTMMEAIRLGKQTLVIPRDGPREEQKMRSQIFMEMGLVTSVESPSRLDVQSLIDAMEEALISPKKPSIRIDMNGQKNSIQTIHQLLNKDGESSDKIEKLKVSI